MTNPMDDFSTWIGRTATIEDDVSASTAQAAAAMFDMDPTPFISGAELPPLWHWFYFLPKAPQNQLGVDGHPAREVSSFMPPIELPRRMFAGARLTWHRPLVAGQPARREAIIRNISRKSGRSGELAFVTVVYRYFQANSAGSDSDGNNPPAHDVDSNLCIEEEQDIVYREPGAPLPAPIPTELPALPDESWSQTVVPDTRLLFRFSALTFNAHRIHYDRPYAMTAEGYPGLVVHGPLTAILLLQLARSRTHQAVRTFRFRGQAPLFDLAPFRLVAVPSSGDVELQAQGPDAKTTMVATAGFA